MKTAFPSAPSAPRPVILLVDDTPANLDLLRAMLSPYYDLRIANRGAKALAICASGEPIDLISRCAEPCARSRLRARCQLFF